jgi:hypothetical protein
LKEIGKRDSVSKEQVEMGVDAQLQKIVFCLVAARLFDLPQPVTLVYQSRCAVTWEFVEAMAQRFPHRYGAGDLVFATYDEMKNVV